MKTRESGMPEEARWRTFFDPDAVLTALQLDEQTSDVVDFGCGYGIFSLPAARRIKGTMYGIDIEAVMVTECERRAAAEGLHNTRFYQKDFVSDETGLDDASVDYAMLFNILHAETPLVLLREAWRILKPGGRLAVMHWNYDPTTPRGPSMDIRPHPQDCLRWMQEAGFEVKGDIIDLPPYHYGLMGHKKGNVS